MTSASSTRAVLRRLSLAWWGLTLRWEDNGGRERGDLMDDDCLLTKVVEEALGLGRDYSFEAMVTFLVDYTNDEGHLRSDCPRTEQEWEDFILSVGLTMDDARTILYGYFRVYEEEEEE